MVVGIGASAGGLDALKAFFSALPPRTGLAFVVVVHLDPTHESSLPELLARVTPLRVEQARDRQVLEPDHVYVIPPNRHLTVDQGLIRTAEPLDRRALRGTIDHFFRSLARSLGERAVGVILSGTGTEGTLGAAAVKAEGGMMMAQEPGSALQSGMPASAIASGLVDFVLPPERMPEALFNYIRHPYLRPHTTSQEEERKPGESVQSVISLLRARTKVDFRGYKKGTLQRRIERRMGLQQINSVRRYVEFAKSTPGEVDLLFKDLLIGVTSFFRDAPAFEELSTLVLSKLVVDDGGETAARVWVPGCATGEEAYSIAILAAEQAALVQSPRRIQIFATDLDESALETARGGTYPESIALDVSPQRLQRFFVREDHRYRVSKTIRESVVFAGQDLISDPPFSKLDLVSCRNVLIYLEPDVQRKVVALFHFSLNPGGCLFLGGSESTGEDSELFAPLSKRWRIYTRLGPSKTAAIDIPFPKTRIGRGGRDAVRVTSEPMLSVLADQQLLAHFAPAAVVVNRLGQILHFAGAMSRYLNLPAGAPTLDLALLARESLKPVLRALLHDGIRKRRRTSIDTTFARGRNASGTLRITVSPVRGTRDEEGLSLVIFEEMPATPTGVRLEAAGKQQRDVVHKLEQELKLTKRDQQSLVEQLESSNQELRAANEEVTSMNEELQSTNEELESSKEELQSMNEELSTLNAQLQEKVHELTGLNDDLNNLLASTDIATVFVDADFRVSRFTAAASRLLNLIPSDVGRPIGHLATTLVDFELAPEADTVLRGHSPIEKAVQARDGRHYIVRLLPYLREGKIAQGVVVTLTDVTALKASEQELRLLNQTLEQRVLDRTKRLLLLHDVARTISDASSWDEALHGILHIICDAESWQIGAIYLAAEGDSSAIVPTITYVESDRFRSFHPREPRHVESHQGMSGAVYRDDRALWVDDQESLIRVLPSRAEVIRRLGLQSAVALPLGLGGQTLAVLELLSTAPRRSGTELAQVLTDVAAQISVVLDRRRTMSEAAELVWREQQSLVHTLHDSLGQQLTGIAMLSTALIKRLHSSEPEVASIVKQIAEQAQQSMEQVRQLSRGLFPVEVDADGLVHALERLAATMSSLGTLCVVEDVGRVRIRDNRVATELYRIGQEAVTNALKHAEAHHITVRLVTEAGIVILTITDDGTGFDGGSSEDHGVGLRIMRYRAQSIGATFTVERASGHGTVVTCSLRDAPQGDSAAGSQRGGQR